MHRDVSVGNLLIYPHVHRIPNGKYQVYWRGFLSDWELAKHCDKTVATQPQRAVCRLPKHLDVGMLMDPQGTWHFLSVHLLNNPSMPTSIPDELESFLHVLIYAVLRRMRSDDIECINDFLEEYFAGYSIQPLTGEKVCPPAKYFSVVVCGALIMTRTYIKFSTPDGRITREHPINKLIADLLRVFHSRYVILRWQQRTTEKEKEKAQEEALTAESRLLTNPVDDFIDEPDPEEIYGVISEPEPIYEDRASTPEPPPWMYTNMKALEQHVKVGRLFYNCFMSEDKWWPQDDVIPDRMNEGFKPFVPPLLPQANTTAARDALEDVPMDDDDPKVEPSALVAATPTTVAPAHRPPDAEGIASAANAETRDAPSPERPKKRRRKDPVVKDAGPSESPVAELPTRHITRSRAAPANVVATRANAAVNAVIVVPPGPATAAAPIASPPVAPHPPAPTVVQASTRVTRSKSGKLPPAPNRAAAATSGAPTAARRTRTATSRRTPGARTASGPQTRTRRRAGVAVDESPDGAQGEPQPEHARLRRDTRLRRS